MGFNKRFLSQKGILNNLDNIMKYLDADAVYLTDEFSRNVYKIYNSGGSEIEVRKKIEELLSEEKKY